MIAKNCTVQDLEAALVEVNKRYGGNVIFKRTPEKVGRRYAFTLTVKSSKGKGGRLSHSGRRIAAACWHVHGHYFEALLSIAPEAEVVSAKSVINQRGGNWRDSNIGSQMYPMMYSEACDCGHCGL